MGDPVSIGIDGLDHLYVLDQSRRSATLFAPGGEKIKEIIFPVTTIGGLSRPEFVEVDSSGAIFIYDSKERRTLRYR